MAKNKKFEYKIEDEDSVNLDKLGKEGWELVSVVYKTWENERKGYQESNVIYYLKKEKHSLQSKRY